MNGFGTRLSALLYWLLLIAEGLSLLVLVMAVVLAVTATLHPPALDGLDLRFEGEVLDSLQPEVARFAMVLVALAALLTGITANRLRAVAATVRMGTPFVDANVARLRTIAVLIALLAIADPLFALVTPAPILAALGQPESAFDWGGLFAALTVLVLAEVFAAGVALREDVEATI